MLHLIQSNKMECLADSLISCLQETTHSGGSVFESDVVLVQSPGMSQWLKIQIAEQMGIAANIDFPLPSSFIWQLYRQHIETLPEQSAFTKPNMTWKLMAVLPNMLDNPEFAPVKNYLSGAQPLKLYQLAHKIADVYDQYLVYRPEWVLSWEGGANELPELPQLSHLWQPILWRALVEYTHSLGESAFHRANLHQKLLTALSNQTNKQQTTKPLMVFGISAMPQQQLEVLKTLGESRDVVIFWFNPSQHYWGDIVDAKTQAKFDVKALKQNDLPANEFLDIGNPLLASWGKLGRDYQDMLLSLEIQQQDCFIDPKPANLLEHIQSDVNNLQYRAASQPLDASELLSNGVEYPKIEISPEDSSLTIHACHSKVRELEVLHDQLLKQFKYNPDWHPGDVIVMMPDVTGYAPFIEGVFGAVDSELAIPFAISDRNAAQVSPIISSFLQLMKLHHSRLTLSEVLSILEVPAVLRKFDISLQEFDLLKHWLIDSGVRWGWDGADKQRWQLPAEKQNTWMFGLQRLLAGYAMSGEHLYKELVAQQSEQLISPYADIEGQQAVALGKCYQFISVLLEAHQYCEQPAAIQQKVAQALSLLESLYLVDESEQAELVMLRETVEKLLPHAQQYPHEIEQDVFVSELEQNIQEKGVGQRFLAGYVNFCTLMPMRSIPFKMVCLLGMNDADYPRQTVPIGFDLMRQAPAKKGDRSRRLDDRYLFLEALFSARDSLYFSYIGYSQRDNSELAPSILLSELLEYCQQGFSLQGQLNLPVQQTEKNLSTHLLCKHKLQPFDESYYLQNSDQRLFSFNLKQCAVAQQIKQPSTEQEFSSSPLRDLSEQANKPIELAELINFFQNPAKGFFSYRWQSRFYPLGEQHSDQEPFVFDGLDRYQLNERFIASYVKKQLAGSEELTASAPEDVFAELSLELKAEGKLPSGQTGKLALQPLIKQSMTLAEQVISLAHPNSQAATQDIELQIEDQVITGRVSQLYGQSLICWRPGKIRAKDRLSIYLQWLCLCISPPKSGLNQAHFISTEKPYSLPVIEKTAAQAQLSAWVDVYRQGQDQVVHFYPESAWQWVKTQDLNKTLQTFIGNDFATGEGSEAHIQRVCADLEQHFDEFSQLSDKLFLPLIELEASL